MRSSGCFRRRGFTYVEVLAAIAIVGILAGLSSPAIQYAREAARRSQCSVNLRQLAIGFQQYVEVYGQYPPDTVEQTESHLIRIPPYIGQELLFEEEYNFDNPLDDRNALVRSDLIPQFLCPSVPMPNESASFSHPTNYLGNGGSGTWEGAADGFFGDYAGLTVRPQDVSDGLSRTAISTEA
ncbi:MAG: DUF1559 domain-containing protein [Planctomycetia bacterium]